MIYLDNSATTKQHDKVTQAMLKMMESSFGNPSSLHRLGMESEQLLKMARTSAKSVMGDGELTFTSGGTEGDNWAVIRSAEKGGKSKNKIITTSVEHPAVLRTCESLENIGYEVYFLKVNDKAEIDLCELEDELDESCALVSVMAANNEVGTVYPINAIRKLIDEKAPGTILHSDCVQALGKLNVRELNAHIKTVSGHKIYGPKGIGANLMEKGTSVRPFILGGGQESNLRSGTENMPAIIGFGVACKLALENFDHNIKKMGELKEYLKNGLSSEIKDIRINSPEDGLSSILNVSFLGTRGEVILHRLEQDEIYVSTGSACSSKKTGGSHVLKSMGLNKREIEGAIRFSFNPFLKIEDMDVVIDKTAKAVNSFRRLGAFR